MSIFHKALTLKNGETLTLRNAEAADAEALLEYLPRVDTQTRFLAREPGEFSCTLDQERELLDKFRLDPASHFIIAEYGGHIAGTANALPAGVRRRFAHRATMGISVDEAYWRLGIGSAMLSELIDWCCEYGFEQLELDVVADNARAIALYERFGFQTAGRRPNAMKYADGTYADELIMVRPLKKDCTD